MFGIRTSSVKDYLTQRTVLAKHLTPSVIFPAATIRDNIENEIFQDPIHQSKYLAAEIDLENLDLFDLCVSLSITTYFFKIVPQEVAICAVKLTSVIQNNPTLSFVAFCDNVDMWLAFSEICGNPPNLLVCISFPKTVNPGAWISTQAAYVYLHPHNFNEKGDIDNDTRIFLELMNHRAATFILDSDTEKFDEYFATIYSILVSSQPCLETTQLRNPMQFSGCYRELIPVQSIESDKKKYQTYLEAFTSILKSQPESSFVVLNPFRGKLIDCLIKAGAKKIYAIEKNPAFLLILLKRNTSEWKGLVKLEDPTEKVDYAVYDHFGLFAHNFVTKPSFEVGAYLPATQYSYLVPISSQYLWTRSISVHFNYAACDLRNSVLLSDPLRVFDIKPGEGDVEERFIYEWVIPIDSICHGFGGWCQSTLFGNIKLSSEPGKPTPGLMTWSPFYLPLPIPIHIHQDQSIKLLISRIKKDGKEWIEWSVLQPVITPVYNSNGSDFHIE